MNRVISGRMRFAAISWDRRTYASRGRDGLEPSRVADTNQGRSCHSSAARPDLEAAVRAGTPPGGPDALGLVGFPCGGGVLTWHRRPVRANRQEIHQEHAEGVGPSLARG